jgi:hypothetical protein
VPSGSFGDETDESFDDETTEKTLIERPEEWEAIRPEDLVFAEELSNPQVLPEEDVATQVVRVRRLPRTAQLLVIRER